MKQQIILSIFLLFAGTTLFAQSSCVGLQSVTVSPTPDSGKYLPGTTVTFCYTLHSYNSTSDWLHGFVLTFGPGWDTTTLTPLSSPSSCDGAGNWGFFDSCIGTKGNKFGQGFYYDRSISGIPGTGGDGIPGNNLGDDDMTNCSWTFCFSIKVKDTSSLYLYITPLSDGTIDGDTSSHCVNTPSAFFPSSYTAGIRNIGITNPAINIYPNPSTDWLAVNLTNLQTVKELTVFDLLGGEIYHSPENEKTALLNVSVFPNGIYFLIIKSGNDVLQRRFIVQH